MEEGKKKVIMIVVIVVCFATAGIIYYKTHRSESIEAESGAVMVQLKCSDPNCGHEWQMAMEDYAAYIKEHEGPTRERPAIACPKCDKKSGLPVDR